MKITLNKLLFFLKNGYTYSSLFNLDLTFISFIIPRLKQFRKISNTYPSEFNSIEEWYSILDCIIKGFELYEKQCFEENEMGEFDKSMELFTKYIKHLWI